MSTEAHDNQLYQRRISLFWWAQRRSYLLFILRELSSVFVAWFVVYLLLLVHAVFGGSAAYEQFLSWSAHPLMILLNVVALAFVLLHAITWFNLAPQAMVLRVRGRKVAPRAVATAHFTAWAVISLVVACIVFGGS